jgi:hypothetical protein
LTPVRALPYFTPSNFGWEAVRSHLRLFPRETGLGVAQPDFLFWGTEFQGQWITGMYDNKNQKSGLNNKLIA